jgi:NAD(P)-dependent dehydrogenase (short-subunit alcohol dehydrogenase family)
MSITYHYAGQVALVTGAASGMGLATARAFAHAGAAVTLADISEDALQRAVDEIKSAGGNAIGVLCDAPLLPLAALMQLSTMQACRLRPPMWQTNRRRRLTG